MSTDIETLQRQFSELEEVARGVVEHNCNYCPGGPYNHECCWLERHCLVAWLIRILDQKEL